MLYPNRVRTHLSYLRSNIKSYSSTPCVIADYDAMGAVVQGLGFVGREVDGTLRIPRNEKGYVNICNPSSKIDLENEVVITTKPNTPATYFGVFKYIDGGNPKTKAFLENQLPLIPFNEALYEKEEDFDSYKLLTSIQSFPIRRGRHILTPEEYKSKFGMYEGALNNLERLFAQDLRWKPTSRKSMIADDSPEYRIKLSNICVKSLIEKGLSKNKKYVYRLQRELAVINEARYNNYFLMAQTIVNKARERGVMVGPGRGSAAGSLVVYLLGITKIDPIQFDLIFERFLNPHRVSPPDIDIDFQDTRRQEVIDIIKELFGDNSVSLIPTFQVLKAKSAFNETAKYICSQNEEYDDQTLKSLLAIEFPKEESIESLLNNKAFLQDKPPMTREVLLKAQQIEGLYRHSSMHPSGVVVSPKGSCVWDFAPISKKETGELITHFDCSDTESFSGLLKVDVLGLKALSIVEDIILRTKDKKSKCPESTLTQKVTMQGVFQYESPGMSKVIYEIRPSTVTGLANISALYRPGPMQWIPIYTQKLLGQPVTTNPVYEAVLNICDKSVEIYNVLKSTQFIPIYQEQIIHIITNFAGFSAAEADVLRKAIGKKQPEVLRDAEVKFVTKSVENGKSESIAKTVFNQVILPFQGYGFNKSHAIAYAALSMKMIKLKKAYPFDFIASCISFQKSAKEMLRFFLDAISYGGIVLPPLRSKSGLHCTVYGNCIYMGLLSIVGLGNGSKDALEFLVKNKHRSYQDIINDITDDPSIPLRASDFYTLFVSGYFDEEENNAYYKSNVNNVFEAIATYRSKLKRNQQTVRDINVDTIPPDDDSLNRLSKLSVLGFEPDVFKSLYKMKKSKMRIGYTEAVSRGAHCVYPLSYINPKRVRISITNKELVAKQIKQYGFSIINLQTCSVQDI